MTKRTLKNRLFCLDAVFARGNLILNRTYEILCVIPGQIVRRPSVAGACAAGQNRHISVLHRPDICVLRNTNMAGYTVPAGMIVALMIKSQRIARRNVGLGIRFGEAVAAGTIGGDGFDALIVTGKT